MRRGLHHNTKLERRRIFQASCAAFVEKQYGHHFRVRIQRRREAARLAAEKRRATEAEAKAQRQLESATIEPVPGTKPSKSETFLKRVRGFFRRKKQ